MFDVYVKETHPNSTTPQPKTFEERIAFYEKYASKYNMTIPALIDQMDNRWKNLYDPGPTSCTLIDIRGIVVYTHQFIMSGGYSTIESKTDALLSKTEEQLTLISHTQQSAEASPFLVKRISSDRYSIVISSPGPHDVSVFNLQGVSVFSRKGYGGTEFPFNTPVSAGKYLIRVKTEDKTVIRPITVNK